MSISDSDKECPLCMETLDWDDLSFYPCSCGYQICRFCWHRLRTDENGLCPACRQTFPDIPVSFNPKVSIEELKKQRKRNKERNKSNKDQVIKAQDLATLRVVQKNLVFVIGLSHRLTHEDLKKEFAHFGKIIKFVHNKSTAYVTFSKPEEAIRAIRTLNASAAQESMLAQQQHTQLLQQLSSNNGINQGPTSLSMPTAMPSRLKASLGTTKYCNHFLKSQQCPKVGECMYLHEIADAEASFTKEQMQAGKHVEYEKKLMDFFISKYDQLTSINNNRQNASSIGQQQLSNAPPLIKQNLNVVPSQSQTAPQQQHQQPQSTSTQQQQSQTQQQPIQQQQQQQLIQPQSIHQSELQQTHQLQQQLMQESQNPDQGEQHQQNQQLAISSGQLNTLESNSLMNSNSLFTSCGSVVDPVMGLARDGHNSDVEDSEDDGLDFDPISVSAKGLRDMLMDQQNIIQQQIQQQQQHHQHQQHQPQRLFQLPMNFDLQQHAHVTDSSNLGTDLHNLLNRQHHMSAAAAAAAAGIVESELTGGITNTHHHLDRRQQAHRSTTATTSLNGTTIANLAEAVNAPPEVTWQNLKSLFPNVNITFNSGGANGATNIAAAPSTMAGTSRAMLVSENGSGIGGLASGPPQGAPGSGGDASGSASTNANPYNTFGSGPLSSLYWGSRYTNWQA